MEQKKKLWLRTESVFDKAKFFKTARRGTPELVKGDRKEQTEKEARAAIRTLVSLNFYILTAKTSKQEKFKIPPCVYPHVILTRGCFFVSNLIWVLGVAFLC